MLIIEPDLVTYQSWAPSYLSMMPACSLSTSYHDIEDMCSRIEYITVLLWCKYTSIQKLRQMAHQSRESDWGQDVLSPGQDQFTGKSEDDGLGRGVRLGQTSVLCLLAQ